jgi:hypothetical protein
MDVHTTTYGGPNEVGYNRLLDQPRSSDSAPSEARKWGSGGGSPRKYDDLLTGASDMDVQNTPRKARFASNILAWMELLAILLYK